MEPSVACYHAAMFACGKPDPGRWMEAIDLLREMKARGLPVTVRTCPHGDDRKRPIAFRVLKRMVVVWVWGQVEAYNEAIFACGKAHEVSSARACRYGGRAARC